MFNIPSGHVNIASIIQSTQALGPGVRAVVWVQGCPFRCTGCIAPGMIPFQKAQLVTIEDLANDLLSSSAVNGLTFSGGEPMEQAMALAGVAKLVRKRREVNIITFTGYRYETLVKQPTRNGISELLAQTDVLIEGSYLKSLNNGTGLRGSTNQRIIHLTSRLKQFDLENYPRQNEILFNERDYIFIGIPAYGVQESLETALRSPELTERISHERI